VSQTKRDIKEDMKEVVDKDMDDCTYKQVMPRITVNRSKQLDGTEPTQAVTLVLGDEYTLYVTGVSSIRLTCT